MPRVAVAARILAVRALVWCGCGCPRHFAPCLGCPLRSALGGPGRGRFAELLRVQAWPLRLSVRRGPWSWPTEAPPASAGRRTCSRGGPSRCRRCACPGTAPRRALAPPQGSPAAGTCRLEAVSRCPGPLLLRARPWWAVHRARQDREAAAGCWRHPGARVCPHTVALPGRPCGDRQEPSRPPVSFASEAVVSRPVTPEGCLELTPGPAVQRDRPWPA